MYIYTHTYTSLTFEISCLLVYAFTVCVMAFYGGIRWRLKLHFRPTLYPLEPGAESLGPQFGRHVLNRMFLIWCLAGLPSLDLAATELVDSGTSVQDLVGVPRDRIVGRSSVRVGCLWVGGFRL